MGILYDGIGLNSLGTAVKDNAIRLRNS